MNLMERCNARPHALAAVRPCLQREMPPVELVEPPCHTRRDPLDSVAAAQPSDPEVCTNSVPRGAWGASLAALGLACLAFVLVLWNALLVYVLLAGLPQNDFC